MDQDVETVAGLTAVLEAQRVSFLAEGLPSAELRRERIQHVIDALVSYHRPLATAMDEDFGGRTPGYSLMNDVLGSLAALKFARDSVEAWMAPDVRPAYSPYDQLGATAEVLHQPKGSVGIIGTWNAPLYTVLAPLAYVLAAGNRAILKPSEVAPRTAALLAEAIASACDPLEVAVVTGGPEIAAAFSAQPFQHLVFTGSSAIGKLVMSNAAQNLVPVTLELGGKSPSVVSRSADISAAAFQIAAGKVSNGGQLCVSPDQVHVPREQVEPFLTALKCHYSELIPSVDGNADVVAVVNDRHATRIDDTIEDAKALGARVESAPDAAVPTDSRRRPLRIVLDAPPEARILQEEIFGPAVVVLPYDTIDEVIDHVNARPNPLALYYFGEDEQEKRTVLDRTLSGGVTVNGVAMHPGMSEAPFGGVGNSGMGHYNGREGFLEFSHARTVFEAPKVDLRREWGMLPPFGDAFFEAMAAQVTA